MVNDASLGRLERIAREEGPERVFDALRTLSLRDVGELLLRVPARCEALRAILPGMPPDDQQVGWNGNSGPALLEQSLAFAGAVAEAFAAKTGRRLAGARILDYGCGWGRLLRLMYGFTAPERLYGCDAWESSLALCREHRIRAQLARCEEIPREAPFPGVKVDLAYAYSLLTHLSERTARAVMAALLRNVDRDGLCVVTVRPVEYWDAHPQSQNRVDVARMKREHAERGFAFTPHRRAPVGGEVTYGDASISLDYMARSWEGWRVAGSQPDGADGMQRLVFLRPA